MVLAIRRLKKWTTIMLYFILCFETRSNTVGMFVPEVKWLALNEDREYKDDKMSTQHVGWT